MSLHKTDALSLIQRIRTMRRRVDQLETAELPRLQGSKTYDWPNLADGAQQFTTVTVTGVTVAGGARCLASLSVSLVGTQLWAYVSAADTVTVIHRNDTGGAVNLASGTLRVDAWV